MKRKLISLLLSVSMVGAMMLPATSVLGTQVSQTHNQYGYKDYSYCYDADGVLPKENATGVMAALTVASGFFTEEVSASDVLNNIDMDAVTETQGGATVIKEKAFLDELNEYTASRFAKNLPYEVIGNDWDAIETALNAGKSVIMGLQGNSIFSSGNYGQEYILLVGLNAAGRVITLNPNHLTYMYEAYPKNTIKRKMVKNSAFLDANTIAFDDKVYYSSLDAAIEDADDGVMNPDVRGNDIEHAVCSMALTRNGDAYVRLTTDAVGSESHSIDTNLNINLDDNALSFGSEIQSYITTDGDFVLKNGTVNAGNQYKAFLANATATKYEVENVDVNVALTTTGTATTIVFDSSATENTFNGVNVNVAGTSNKNCAPTIVRAGVSSFEDCSTTANNISTTRFTAYQVAGTEADFNGLNLNVTHSGETRGVFVGSNSSACLTVRNSEININSQGAIGAGVATFDNPETHIENVDIVVSSDTNVVAAQIHSVDYVSLQNVNVQGVCPVNQCGTAVFVLSKKCDVNTEYQGEPNVFEGNYWAFSEVVGESEVHNLVVRSGNHTGYFSGNTNVYDCVFETSQTAVADGSLGLYVGRTPDYNTNVEDGKYAAYGFTQADAYDDVVNFYRCKINTTTPNGRSAQWGIAAKQIDNYVAPAEIHLYDCELYGTTAAFNFGIVSSPSAYNGASKMHTTFYIHGDTKVYDSITREVVSDVTIEEANNTWLFFPNGDWKATVYRSPQYDGSGNYLNPHLTMSDATTHIIRGSTYISMYEGNYNARQFNWDSDNDSVPDKFTLDADFNGYIDHEFLSEDIFQPSKYIVIEDAKIVIDR